MLCIGGLRQQSICTLSKLGARRLFAKLSRIGTQGQTLSYKSNYEAIGLADKCFNQFRVRHLRNSHSRFYRSLDERSRSLLPHFDPCQNVDTLPAVMCRRLGQSLKTS
jgi:hypothetical protein